MTRCDILDGYWTCILCTTGRDAAGSPCRFERPWVGTFDAAAHLGECPQCGMHQGIVPLAETTGDDFVAAMLAIKDGLVDHLDADPIDSTPPGREPLDPGWEFAPRYRNKRRHIWYRRHVPDGRRMPLLATVRGDGRWEVIRTGILPGPDEPGKHRYVLERGSVSCAVKARAHADAAIARILRGEAIDR